MSNALRVTLIGIILILASLFFMGVCITSRPTASGPEGMTLFLFVTGLVVSGIGLFFIKKD